MVPKADSGAFLLLFLLVLTVTEPLRPGARRGGEDGGAVGGGAGGRGWGSGCESGRGPAGTSFRPPPHPHPLTSSGRCGAPGKGQATSDARTAGRPAPGFVVLRTLRRSVLEEVASGPKSTKHCVL
jgi:hypothetical protein